MDNLVHLCCRNKTEQTILSFRLREGLLQFGCPPYQKPSKLGVLTVADLGKEPNGNTHLPLGEKSARRMPDHFGSYLHTQMLPSFHKY